MDNNDYESINLASTLKSELNAKSPSRHSLYHQKVPVSESESYDDDEFEHDPEEFITDNHNDIKYEHIHREHILLYDKPDEQLAESNNTLTLGLLHLSELVPPLANQNFDEPTKHLSEQIRELENNLVEYSQVYSTLLREGDSNVAEIRSKVLRIFHQLSECYFSLNELYSRDASYTKSVHTYFDTWRLKRDRILQKMQRTKSVESKHGAKLAGLLNESTSVDNEIKELQSRIAALNEKKSLLSKEIEDTTSVLESRTALYGENLRYLELRGKEVLLEYLQNNGLPESDFTSLIKEQAIDLSFEFPKELNNVKEIEMEHENATAQSATHSTSIRDSKTASSIGMKPYEPPLEPAHLLTNDDSLLNHGHGPTAFEKGYAIGAQNSRIFKSQVQSLIHKVVLHVPQRSQLPQIQPNRTLTTTLDVEPITTFLRLRVDALNDLVMSTSKTAASYHGCDNQWNLVQQILASQEEKVESILKESTVDADTMPVIQTLMQTRDKLELAATSISLLHLGGILLQLVSDEINAVNEAFTVVTKEGHNTRSKQMKQS